MFFLFGQVLKNYIVNCLYILYASVCTLQEDIQFMVLLKVPKMTFKVTNVMAIIAYLLDRFHLYI